MLSLPLLYIRITWCRCFVPAAIVEPLQGIVVGTGDTSKLKPALFVVSCGEGHLDLRTADKVIILHPQ